MRPLLSLVRKRQGSSPLLTRMTVTTILQAARMYRMMACKIDTLESGEINYDELELALKMHAGRPAIINVNVGTTVKGAVDDLDKVLECLQNAGYTEDRFYIHCDGALFGLMLPFIRKGTCLGKGARPVGVVALSGVRLCPSGQLQGNADLRPWAARPPQEVPSLTAYPILPQCIS